MRNDPFSGKSAQEIYDIFSGKLKSSTPVPRWPSPEVQAGFISRSGASAVKYTQAYLDLLERDGAFAEGWRGLDYGCGWGRFASLMLRYGGPEQVDLADPMPRVEALINELGFQNRFYLVSQILTEEDRLGSEYDFIFSYSVFTHFNENPFILNFQQLISRLKPDGVLYITVRQEDFLDQFCKYWYKSDADSKTLYFKERLNRENFLFVPIIDHPDRREFWGSAFVTPKYLEDLMPSGYQMKFLGDPDPSQKLYAFSRQR